jgi:(E)-4-hydroxy-3-methylbut-2-enyl-diphosphate synthase
VDEAKSAEGASWLAKIEEENAGELTPERIAQMEAEAAGEEPEPTLQPVPGRRFTRA